MIVLRMAISKADLVEQVAEETGQSKSHTKKVIEATLEAIAKTLGAGDRVTLSGFGTFEVRERRAREGVKPGTGEKIQIPAGRTPAFKAGKALRSRVN